MFAWSAKELNQEQSDAITLPGSVFLQACPGSGKTRTLTYKIAHELSGAESDRHLVAAITYTNRAADQIRQRVEELGVNTSRLWIGTIHAFCLEWIIRPYGLYEPDLAFGYRVIDSHEQEELLTELCSSFGRRVRPIDCGYFFTTHGYTLSSSQADKHPAISQVLDEYFKILAKKRQIDFELILWYASRLEIKKPDICLILSRIFSLVLVDEYQDTKQIQYEILGLILRAGKGATRLFMVGDPNQAIYNSMGGYAIEIDELKKFCGIEISRLKLSQNYRSSQRIVGYFCNFGLHHTPIVACGDLRLYPSLISYDKAVSKQNLVHEITRLIRYNVEKLCVPFEEICVLAPRWFPLAAMTRMLVATMPDYRFDGPGTVPFSRDVENFFYKLARIALTEPSPVSYVRRFRWAREIVLELSNFGIDVRQLSPKLLLQVSNTVVIHEMDGLKYLEMFFEEFFKKICVPMHEYKHLVEHRKAFFDSSEKRVDILAKAGVAAIRDISFFKKVFQSRTGITMSTIHGVKGAEFDVVIAYGLIDGVVPFWADSEKTISSKKLIYVVGSRARKNLHIFSETGVNDWGYPYLPTPCLAQCVFGYDKV